MFLKAVCDGHPVGESLLTHEKNIFLKKINNIMINIILCYSNNLQFVITLKRKGTRMTTSIKNEALKR